MKKIITGLLLPLVSLVPLNLAHADNDGEGDDVAWLNVSTCQAIVSGEMGPFQSVYDIFGYKAVCKRILANAHHK